ncbi:hypothetical protein [Halapricum desulfuricans]|uniref:hypothetical protein n=1 Tax=Halapricum desulfuricans TaxID=2841257 RepID=UPI001E54BD3E|nr:hypothetical protein [Halapricum desulfuricans]
MTDPIGHLKTTAQVVSQLDEMDELIRQLPASVETQQKRNNPHEEGTQAYRAYRQGWYEGYLGYLVLETALPSGQLGKAAKSSSKFQRAVQTLDKAGRLSKAAKYAAKTADTAKAPVRYTGYQLSRGLAATKTIGQQTGRHLLEGARTTAKQVRWARHTRRMDAATARLAADGGADFRRGMYRAADRNYRQSQRYALRSNYKTSRLISSPLPTVLDSPIPLRPPETADFTRVKWR